MSISHYVSLKQYQNNEQLESTPPEGSDLHI